MQARVCGYTMYSCESDGGPQKGPVMWDILISLYFSSCEWTIGLGFINLSGTILPYFGEKLSFLSVTRRPHHLNIAAVIVLFGRIYRDVLPTLCETSEVGSFMCIGYFSSCYTRLY